MESWDGEVEKESEREREREGEGERERESIGSFSTTKSHSLAVYGG